MIKRWIGGSPVSQHYRDVVKADFSLMSQGIAAHTRLAGAALGNFLDDLTNRMSFLFQHQVLSCRSNTCIHILANIGQWPKDQAIRRIARIAVYSGTIIDSIRITYEMKGDGPIRAITVQHGGSGGGEYLNIELAGKFRVNYILF